MTLVDSMSFPEGKAFAIVNFTPDRRSIDHISVVREATGL